MPQIKLRFVTCSDPISFLIRKETDCAYSHVEFVLDEEWADLPMHADPIDLTLGAHLDGGIKLRPLNYANFSACEYATVECTAEQKQAATKSAVACIGSPYDVADIAGILFHQNWTEKGHWICSVFVAEKLINAGICILRVAPNVVPSITPRDVYLSPALTRKES